MSESLEDRAVRLRSIAANLDNHYPNLTDEDKDIIGGALEICALGVFADCYEDPDEVPDA